MTPPARYFKSIALLAALAAAIHILPATGCSPKESGPPAPGEGANPLPPPSGLPRLIDLGADKCIPCKMMAPILEELREEYAGVFEVHFIDVWKDPSAGRKFGLQVIPTQIFFDGEGKELDRHIGFISKEDILATWNKLGIDLKKGARHEAR